MKYSLSTSRYWWIYFKQDIMRIYYKIRYNWNVSSGINGTLLPITGKGKFASVYSKGQIIQIKIESGYPNLEIDEVRIIPCQPNHGVMVERFKNGYMLDRHLLDIDQFSKSIIFASNIEQLTEFTSNIDQLTNR